jgi:hypothetical protein
MGNGSAPADGAPPVYGRPERARRRTWLWVVFGLVALIVAGGIVYLLTRGGGPQGTAADAVLAGSVNLRASDLPSDWISSHSTAPVPPLAPATKLVAAQQTLATCLGQSAGTVQGWFGAGSFQGQVTQVRSPTFGKVTAPTEQMDSITSVLASTAESRSLATAVGSPKFASCFGQYQVTAVALPATAAVQSVALPAISGVEGYGYVTTLTLPGVGNEIVGDAFIIGDRVVTRLRASTDGPVIPPATFEQAYRGVAGRVASANVG